MKYSLKHTGVALRIFAVSMLTAQAATAVPPPKETSPAATKVEAAKKETKGKTKAAAVKGKTKARGKADQAAQERQGTSKKEEAKQKVEGATEQAHESASEANKQVVGEETQTENERRAREQREREAKEEKAAKRTGEEVGRATTTAATTMIDAAQDVTRATDQPGEYSPLVVSWNPLGAVVGGRVSFNVEYAPVTHHVIIVSPHFANPSEDVLLAPGVTHTNRFTGGGGEIGYRYYTGRRGPNGIFIGPSIVGGVYNADLMRDNTVFTNIGVAADVGVQALVWDHLALGAGVGVEYLYVSRDFGDVSTGPSTIASSGVKPRLLAQAGYAF